MHVEDRGIGNGVSVELDEDEYQSLLRMINAAYLPERRTFYHVLKFEKNRNK